MPCEDLPEGVLRNENRTSPALSREEGALLITAYLISLLGSFPLVKKVASYTLA